VSGVGKVPRVTDPLVRTSLYGLRRGFDAAAEKAHLSEHEPRTDGRTDQSVDPGAIPDHRVRSLPSKSPHKGTEGDPGAATAGARTRAPAPATALRAAEQGTISATRLGPSCPLQWPVSGRTGLLAISGYRSHLQHNRAVGFAVAIDHKEI
jgi:hypothetical protein